MTWWSGPRPLGVMVIWVDIVAIVLWLPRMGGISAGWWARKCVRNVALESSAELRSCQAVSSGG